MERIRDAVKLERLPEHLVIFFMRKNRPRHDNPATKEEDSTVEAGEQSHALQHSLYSAFFDPFSR